MTATPASPASTSPPQSFGWFGLPRTLIIGLVVGVLGFLFSFTIYQSSSDDGVVLTCISINIGAFMVAIACLVLAVVAITQRSHQRRTAPSASQAPAAVFFALTAVLGLLCAAHVVRGLELFGGRC